MVSITKAVEFHNPYALEVDNTGAIAVTNGSSGFPGGTTQTVEMWYYGEPDASTNNSDDDGNLSHFEYLEADGNTGELSFKTSFSTGNLDITFAETPVCQFADLDNEYMTIPAYSPVGNDFTIECLVRLNTVDVNGRIVEYDDGNPEILIFSTAANINYQLEDDASVAVNGVFGAGANDGLWHHLALTVNRTTDIVTPYFDGTPGTAKSTAALGNITITNAGKIASSVVGGTLSVEMDMSYLRIWSDERTLTEINDNMYVSVQSGTAGLERLYTFDDNDGTDFENAQNGTLFGAPTIANTADTFLTALTGAQQEGWHHYAFVHDAKTLGAGEIHFYLDSVLTASSTGEIGKPCYLPTLTNHLLRGDGWGKCAELRIWNDVRTAAEIADNMFVQLEGTEAGLYAYYRFKDKSGTPLTDETANGIDGTITLANASWATGFAGADGSGSWDSLTADLQLNSFRHGRGLNGINPKSRVASPGKFSFSLNDMAQNSGGLAGYYALDNSNLRDGFQQGAKVRVKYTYSGTDYYKWKGKIYDVKPDASPFGSFSKISCFDWMKEAQTQKFKATTVATDQTGDAAITTMVSVLDLGRRPTTNSYDTGKSTFPFVFDSERDEKSSIMSVFQKVALSEMGKVYINSGAGNGEQLVFENRHHSITETTVQHDFDDNVVDVTAGYPFSLIKTKVVTRAFPRRIDSSDVVLGALQKSFSVPPSQTVAITLDFRDPNGSDRISASSLAARVSGTDYIANAQEDGGGADRTADLTVSENTVSGNSITLDCENTGASLFWVTTLQQQGKGIYLYDPVRYEVSATGSYIPDKGEHVLRYDLPYEDDYNEAVSFGDYLLSVWKDPIAQIDRLTYFPEESATLAQAFCDIVIGNRITVNLTQLGIDQDYFVRKIDVSLQKGKIKCAYSVVPADSSVWMTLDDAVYGKLDAVECKLAF